MQFATYAGVLLFWHVFTKRIGNINACLPKETTRKFSKSLRLSVSVLPRKELKDVFSFQTSRRQHNTVSRATCFSRATGWANLPYDVSKANFHLSTCPMFIWPWPEILESGSDIFSTSSDLIISPPWLGCVELDNDVSFDGAQVTTVSDIFLTSAVLITVVWCHMMTFPSLHNYRLFLTSRCLFEASCFYLF